MFATGGIAGVTYQFRRPSPWWKTSVYTSPKNQTRATEGGKAEHVVDRNMSDRDVRSSWTQGLLPGVPICVAPCYSFRTYSRSRDCWSRCYSTYIIYLYTIYYEKYVCEEGDSETLL